MATPKVSVCIPTYDYGRYLTEAVDSVLRQNYDDFELLVIDDCSRDDTNEIMQGFARQDSRIRYLRNPENLGMVKNWNRCLDEAKGEYVKFLFGDDLLVSPDVLARMASVLDAVPSVTLVGSARRIIDEQSTQCDVWSFFDRDGIYDGAEIITASLIRQFNPIGEPSAVMFRKSEAGRGFNGTYRQIVDLDMWFHLLEKGHYAHFSEPLCAFRIHDEQQTAKNAKTQAFDNDFFSLSGEYLDKPYIALSAFDRGYFHYDRFYRFWKMYKKKGAISREQALAKIAIYGTVRFFALYPFYKTYKPLRKFVRFFRKQDQFTIGKLSV